jgi:maleate cis-trans isomerase
MSGTADGWKGRIGWIRPSSADRSLEDFFRMTPADVDLIVCTTMWSLKIVHAGAFDADGFAAMRGEILQTVRLLITEQAPDYIAINGDLLQSAMGPRWAQELGESITAEVGTPTTTAMAALTAALGHLGVRRVAVGTPFRAEQNAHVQRYLEQAGFAVTAIAGYPTHTPADIRALGPETPYLLGKQVFSAQAGAEAVFLPCSTWRGATDAIARLEAELGVPVVTTYSPILWQALRTLHYPTPVHGFGRLLE